MFALFTRNCPSLTVVDAIAADRSSQDAILNGLVSSLNSKLRVLRIASMHNPLKLQCLSGLECLEELDLSEWCWSAFLDVFVCMKNEDMSYALDTQRVYTWASFKYKY